MRAVIQRVKRAHVTVNGETIGSIGAGLLVLLAVHAKDNAGLEEKMADKIIGLRIFADNEGKMNLSLRDTKGEILAVSQFTLYGNCRKGNRPGFTEAAAPDRAIPIYENFVSYVRGQGIKTATGRFGSEMTVELVNDGPVTLIIDY